MPRPLQIWEGLWQFLHRGIENVLQTQRLCLRWLKNHEHSPERGADLEALDRWLATAEPSFDPAGTPLWDGSHLDLHYAVSSMLSAHSVGVLIGED